MAKDIVTIIGMGEIGTAIYDDINKTNKVQTFCVDANPVRVAELCKQGYFIGMMPRQSDVYIISVYTTEQVLSAVKTLPIDNKPLVSIESTINPAALPELCTIAEQAPFDFVLFPHRYNPADQDHRIFNLDRILGSNTEHAQTRALHFYQQFMPLEHIHCVPLHIAALSKIVENTYRFIEIAIAQTFKKSCDLKDIDFEQLRTAVNTKWNINLKEARDGIKGKCLPKDATLLSTYFPDNELIQLVLKLNKEYIIEQEENNGRHK